LKVAVIGSSGGMGKFFARYFLSRGEKVTGSDLRKTGIKHQGFSFVRSNEEAVKDADLVVIATPVDTTVQTVQRIQGSLKQGAMLLEMSSVKSKTLGPLKKLLAGLDFRLLSVHPLFGPSLSNYHDMRICAVDADQKSLRQVRRLFPEATIIPMKAEEHDRMMGLILSLTHLMNIAYAATVIKVLKPKQFRAIQTPTSGVQLTLAEGILSQDPSLYSYIQLENEHSAEYASALIGEISALLAVIQRKDRKEFERLFSSLSRGFEGDSKAALGLVYQAFEKSTRYAKTSR
jgi:prephenate dehydrogenase